MVSLLLTQQKITISAKELGLKGGELESLLVDDYNIQMELSDYYNTLGLITIGDTEESVNKLLDALRDISRRFFGKGKHWKKYYKAS